MERLTEIVSDNKQSSYSRGKAAELIGALGLRYNQSFDSLEKLISDINSSDYAKSKAIDAVIRLGHPDHRIVQSLILTIKNDKVALYVRQKAARCLAGMGVKSDEAAIAIKNILFNPSKDFNSEVSTATVDSLIGIAESQPVLKEVLLGVLALDGIDRTLKFKVAEEATKAGIDHPLVTKTLCNILEENIFPRQFRTRAANVLEMMAKRPSACLQPLFKLFVKTDLDRYGFQKVAEVLERVSLTDPRVKQYLMTVVSNSTLPLEIRFRALSTTLHANLGVPEKAIVSTFLDFWLLTKTKKENV